MGQDKMIGSQDVFLASTSSAQGEAAPSSAQTLVGLESETPVKLGRGMNDRSKAVKEASSSPLSEVEEEAVVQVEELKLKEDVTINVDMDDDSPVRPSVSLYRIKIIPSSKSCEVANADRTVFSYFFPCHVYATHVNRSSNHPWTSR